ncbi:MAG: hemolysin family protein [Gammaproteobacteria bacterium]|nr:hemolysin family protein [Gammaproteobacteria bacterium]
MEITVNLLAIVILLAANGFFVATGFAILRSLDVEEATHADVLSGDELKGLVATSREHGEIEHDKAAMLHSLFEFDQRYVGRVMISRNDTDVLDIAATGDANLQRIKDEAHSRFPVIDGGNDDRIVGILLTKDIYTALISGEHEPWQDLQRYVREPLVVPETQKVSELFELMRTRRAHLAIVVDEYGTFAGIVSLEDLLEEIVGEIHDETDDEQAAYDIESIADNHWEVDGLVTLNDLEKAIDFEVADDLDANTLSGLFMNRLQRMPVIGDEIVQGAYKLKVLSHSDRRVGRVAIERIPGNAIAADDSDDNKD